jgi:serine/threonine protein phosphatase PrpC
LHSVLDDEEIESIVRGTPGVRKIARELGEEVLRRGADDNVTVAVVEFAHGLAMLQSETG